jgi:signal transduction histidine kinase
MSTSSIFIYFFESITVFMGIYFLIQYSILRKKEYLNYAIYLLLLGVYYICAIPELFNPDPGRKLSINFFELFKRPVQFSISFFYTLFIIYYLNLARQSKPLYRIFKVFLALYIVLSVACFIGNITGTNYDTVYYIISLVMFPIQMYMVTALFKYKVPYAKYIIWGSINVLIGSVVTLFLGISMVKNPEGPITNAISYIPVMISIVADIFLFTLALQRKIADNEKSLINAAIARQQAVAKERERIIADLHDDVGGGLSSIRMMSDLMVLKEGNNPDPDHPNFAGKISSTAKDIAQRMNTIIWSLNTENDSLQNFAEYVRQYGVSFFENSSIVFHFSASPALPEKIQLSGGQRKNLFLITKESLHNILKHSEATSAEIFISLKQNKLHLLIKDNGKGLQNNNSFGNGLKNMQKRMNEINGSFDIQSDNGTVITVSLQLS